MTIDELLTPLESLTDVGHVKERTGRAIAWLGEDPTHVIPSFELRSDGPVLASVFLISERFLAEVTLPSDGSETFDFVDRNEVFNIRVRVFTAELGEGEDGATKVQIPAAVVELYHGNPRFMSALNYFGDDPEAWLKSVVSAIPADLVLPSGPG